MFYSILSYGWDKSIKLYTGSQLKYTKSVKYFTLNMALHDNIKKIRELKGLSIPDLAEKMGIDKAGIYKWEEGTVVPGGKKLTAIADALGVTVNDLLAENIAPVQNRSDNKENPLGDLEVYRTIVEGKTEYLLIPRSVLQEKYRIQSIEDMEKDRAVLDALIEFNRELLRRTEAPPINQESVKPSKVQKS
jgi:transcriptional regulator with XRE-family HTH domain